MSAVDTQQRVFTAKRTAELIGCTYRQIDWWDRTGVLKPSIVGANGSGSRRKYSTTDVLLGRIVATVLASGAPLDAARRALPFLRELIDTDDMPAGFYLTRGGELHLEPVTGAYTALADLDQPMTSGGSEQAPPPVPATGTSRRATYRLCDCGRPCDGPYCSPECAPGGAW